MTALWINELCKRLWFCTPRLQKAFSVVCFISLIIYLYFDVKSDLLPEHIQTSAIRDQISTEITKSASNPEPPLILFWTIKRMKFMKELLQTHQPCPYKCRYSYDRADQTDAIARIFHIRDIEQKDLPPRNPNAYNVYFMLESPVFFNFPNSRMFRQKLFDDFFNLSITYRSNADVYYPYDSFVEKDGSENKDDVWTEKQVEEHITKKSKPALIAVTNCHYSSSGRNEYLNELKKHLNITQVGRCNRINCNKTCLDNLRETHYFYLAFENSVCPEYTTEKFWRIKHLIVPVVLSRGAVSPNIPSDSFIAASDFETPKKLADYLMELTNDKDKYKSYFNWTKRYRRSVYNEAKQMPMCQLCRLVTKGIKQRKVYTSDWNENQCIRNYGTRLINNRTELLKDEEKMKTLLKETGRKRLVDRVDD